MSDVAEKVKHIIAEQLEIESEKITEEAKMTDDLGADSLDMVELMVMLEEEFYIKIPDAEAKKIITVDEIIEYVNNKLAAK